MGRWIVLVVRPSLPGEARLRVSHVGPFTGLDRAEDFRARWQDRDGAHVSIEALQPARTFEAAQP